MSLIFDEKTLLNQNIFKFENRLKANTSRFMSEAATLVTYYQLHDNRITVDRGFQSIDKLFGKQSPLRFNKIKDFPMYGLQQMNPSNDDSTQIEDIHVEGECIILPSTIVPNPNDFFTLNHLRMKALFRVMEVQFDSMKVNGFYKIKYQLYASSDETLMALEKQTINTFITELNALGTELNPIIQEDDFILRSKIKQMVNKIIYSYRSLFYETNHNCFLYLDPETRFKWFDLCGNEFIAKHNLMNIENSSNVIVLSDKLQDQKFPLYYNMSIYNWLELHAPLSFLQPFYFNLCYASNYSGSSFELWGEDSTYVITPCKSNKEWINNNGSSYFDSKQLKAFNSNIEPTNDFEKIIYNYIHNTNMTLKDIPLTLADGLLLSQHIKDIFLYTPIVLYIIKQLLRMN